MYEDSDSSEYLHEAEEGVQGGDDTDSEEEPIPLEIQPPVQTRLRKVCAKRAKGSTNMHPGRQSKRVRPNAPIEVPPAVSTRSEREQTSAQAEDNVQEKFPLAAENNNSEAVGNEELLGNNGVNRSASPVMDGSYPDDVHGDDECDHGEKQTPLMQTKSTDEVSGRRGPRKLSPATRDRRLPISIEEGKRRPHEPVQAAKFASEAGVIVRSQVPIFTHWKQYKQTKDFDDFMGKLAGKLAINTTDKPTKEACVSVFQSGVRQARYRLKKAYFSGIPANEIRKTSPVPYMTDAQWCELVEKWSSAKNKAISDKAKRSRGKVKYHQTTGSRSYVAQLHTYKEKNKNKDVELGEEHDEELDEEVDAVEVFKDFHTSSKKGLSDTAREAIITMENIRAQAVAGGQAPMPSVEVVSKVLAHNVSNSSFLKNIGIPTSSTKTETTETSRESELQQELAAEKQVSTALHQEVGELKKKLEVAEQALAKSQRELEECKQQQEESNLLLRRILQLNSGDNSRS